MFDFKISVVIPMAGSGERFPSSCPKQYFGILDKPLFMFCVEDFYKLPYIEKICLVTDNVQLVGNIIEKNFRKPEKIIVVSGGGSRHLSIRNGLVALSKTGETYKVVVVHDGVRPFIPEKLLIDMINDAIVYGAAGATRPLISTIVKPLADGTLESSLQRNLYLSSETPQAFLFHIIMSAYEKCSDNDLEQGTECLELALKYCGARAKLLPGPDSLWKVTDKKDFYSLVQYLKELSSDVCLLGEQDNPIIKELHRSLEGRVNCLDCFASGSSIHTNKLFNTVVCLHKNEINRENQLSSFGAILDTDRKGLVIHVVEHSSCEGLQSTSAYEFHSSGKHLKKQYEKLKKGAVVIHYLSHGEEKKLVQLIISLVFIDAYVISGQTLFI